jgi:predicted signal transduction protein with EAL and GGDEF domain
MRKTDLLARLGGDEFAIVHVTGSEPEEAHALAERIIDALGQPFELQGNKVGIGVSIGISSAPYDAASPVELLKQADLALYVAKRGGRDRFVAYDAGMAERFAERRALEAELRLSIDAEGLSVHYQPQVDLESRRIIGLEALARWEHPSRGMVPPSTFIPIAEESGLIVRLGEWVLRRACLDAASWDTEAGVAVNVSSQQFRDEGFVDVVHAVLRESGLPPIASNSRSPRPPCLTMASRC